MENEEYEFNLIQPGEIEGCNIGGILAVPKKITTEKMMVIMQEEKYNHSIKDDKTGENKTIKTFTEAADKIINRENIAEVSKQLGLNGQVVLLPMLPNADLIKAEGKSMGNFGAEFLSKECFTNIPENSKFYRLDDQLEKMIAHTTQKYMLNEKVNGFGHSTSGLSMMRFAMIRPDLIDTLIVGGNADEIPTPVGENANKIGYPFGIKDFKQLFGKEFNNKDFCKIAFRYYVGEYEYVDPNLDGIRTENYGIKRNGNLGSGRNFAPEEAAEVYKGIYNGQYREDEELSVFERLKNVLKEYEAEGLDMRFLIYEKDCHSMISAEDLANAQFESGSKFSSKASEMVGKVFNKAEEIKGFVEENQDSKEIQEYIAISDKIKANKQNGDVEKRVECLKKVDEEYTKNKVDRNVESYKQTLQNMGLTNNATETLAQLRNKNLRESNLTPKMELYFNENLAFYNLASKAVPEAKTEVKQEVDRVSSQQIRREKEEQVEFKRE